MKRHIVMSAAVLALAGGCGHSPPVESAPVRVRGESGGLRRIVFPAGSPHLKQIRVAAVRSAALPCDEISAPGKVEVNPNRVARVAMPIPGRVSQVHVQLGDAVKQGQPLLAIDSPEASEAVAAHRQAQSELRQARSALEKAKNDLSRVQDLYEHRAAPLKDVQQAQNELTQCEAEVEQAQAARDSAVHRLGLLGLKPGEPRPEVTVLAPISGKVIEIAVVRGEYRTDTSANLLTIADLGTVWMAAEVPESSIRLIQVGEAVQVELAAYPGEIRRGRVMRIADMVDPATRTIKVQTELDNPGGRLRPEMFGKIRHSHGACPAPVVPLSAIVHGEGGAYVFIERAPGEFERAPVGMGEVRAGMTQILSGVKQGDRVVVEGSVLLRGHPGGRR